MGKPIRAISLVGMWAFLIGGTCFFIGYFPTAFCLHAKAFEYPAGTVTAFFRMGTSLYEVGCLCLAVNSVIQGTDNFAIATNIVLCIAVLCFFLSTWGSEMYVTVPRYVFIYPDGDFPNPFFFNCCGVYGAIIYHIGTTMLLWNLWPSSHNFVSFWGGALCFWVAIALIAYFGFIIPIILSDKPYPPNATREQILDIAASAPPGAWTWKWWPNFLGGFLLFLGGIVFNIADNSLGPITQRCQQPADESAGDEDTTTDEANKHDEVVAAIIGGMSTHHKTHHEELVTAITELKQMVEALSRTKPCEV